MIEDVAPVRYAAGFRALSSRAARRLFDLVAASFATVAVAPFFLLFVVLIKLSSRGSPFFVQPRRGLDGRIFNIYKLRTLRIEFCDRPDTSQVTQVEDDDDRVFPLGRFLRNRGLDEIPQLLNVLKGDMSIVGPRPHALPHDAAHLGHIADYRRRYEVRPGITGWAQVNGSSGRLGSLGDVERRLSLDLHYIDNYSPLLDLKIIFGSIGIMLFGGVTAPPLRRSDRQQDVETTGTVTANRLAKSP